MTNQEMIDVLSRAEYIDGKCVNVQSKINMDNNEPWRNNKIPKWDFNSTMYRIKPEPKRVQLTQQDLIERIKLGFEAMWIIENGNTYSLIEAISTDGIYRRYGFVQFKDLQRHYTFLDGTPCSKEVECE